MDLLNQIQALPNSKESELKIKDYIKGLGLVLLMFLAETLPQLQEILTGHDFGKYNDAVKIAFVILAWFLQRYFKDNSGNAIPVPPSPPEDMKNAP